MTTIPLTKPIQAHGEEVSELEMGDDATLGSLKGIKLENIADTAVLIRVVAALANIPPSAAATISARDFAPMMEAVTDFLGISPPTGSE